MFESKNLMIIGMVASSIVVSLLIFTKPNTSSAIKAEVKEEFVNGNVTYVGYTSGQDDSKGYWSLSLRTEDNNSEIFVINEETAILCQDKQTVSKLEEFKTMMERSTESSVPILLQINSRKDSSAHRSIKAYSLQDCH